MSKSLKQLRYEYSQLLEQLNANLREQLVVISNTPRVLGQGAVYIIQQVGTNNYKIGFTTNFEQRKYQFDVRLPFEVVEKFVYQTDYYRQIEVRLHEILAPHRLNRSEFFNLTEGQVDEVVDLIPSIETDLMQVDKGATEESDGSIKLDDPDGEIKDHIREYLLGEDVDIKDLSVSAIQRKYRVGYARASRIKEQMINESEMNT